MRGGGGHTRTPGFGHLDIGKKKKQTNENWGAPGVKKTIIGTRRGKPSGGLKRKKSDWGGKKEGSEGLGGGGSRV